MTSQVDICSNALVLLGAKPINSITANGNEREVLVNNVYPALRDKVLRSHPWNCCITQKTLAPMSPPPDFGYSNRFLLPGDWLRTISVGERGYHPDFSMQGGYILANTNILKLTYIFRNENPDTWDAMLIDVMTLALKAAFAYPITKSTSKEQLCLQEYQDAFKRAKAVDGQESPPEQLDDFVIYGSRF